jgi:riboflavin synthase
MFTGLVADVGLVTSIEDCNGDMRLSIEVPHMSLGSLEVGASIAVNGVCLTAVKILQRSFVADVSCETLNLTTLGQLQVGSPVNLESSLTLAAPLGGHLVSGHVDGIANVVSVESEVRSIRMDFELPNVLMRYVARKGSVAIDGTSLTVNAVLKNRVSVNIVPHTCEKTIMREYEVGARVNVEVDLVARYLESLLADQL